MALVIGLGTTAAMAAEPGPYVAGSVGLAFPSTMDDSTFIPPYGDVDAELSFSDAPILSAAVGYAFGNGARIEFEVGRTSLEADEVEVHTDAGSASAKIENLDMPVTLLTLGAYHDFQTGSRFSLYLGGGAGLAITDKDQGAVEGVTIETDEREDLAAFAEAGVNIAATESLPIAPAYRFLWLDRGSDGWDDTTTHILKVAVRYAF